MRRRTRSRTPSSWRGSRSRRLREADRFEAWFDRILVNGCRDRLRRRKIVRFIPMDAGIDPAGRDPFADVHRARRAARRSHPPEPGRADRRRPALLGRPPARRDRRAPRVAARDGEVETPSSSWEAPRRAGAGRSGGRSMSDDLERRLGEAFHRGSLPPAPPSLVAGLQRVADTPVSAPTGEASDDRGSGFSRRRSSSSPRERSRSWAARRSGLPRRPCRPPHLRRHPRPRRPWPAASSSDSSRSRSPA